MEGGKRERGGTEEGGRRKEGRAEQSEGALRAADSLSVAIFLRQPLASNLCFHTLKASRSERRQSFHFQPGALRWTDKQPQAARKKKNKDRREIPSRPLQVLLSCIYVYIHYAYVHTHLNNKRTRCSDLSSGSVWHGATFLKAARRRPVIIQTDVPDRVAERRSRGMNKMIYGRKKKKNEVREAAWMMFLGHCRKRDCLISGTTA